MASYLIKKDKKTGEIILLNYELEGYKMKPNINNEKSLKITCVTVLKPSMIEYVLAIKFNRTFKKLLQVVIRLIEDAETSEDDTIIALDEVDRMQSILEKKYHKFLSNKKEKEFLAKLYFLEKEIKYKQLIIQQRMMFLENKEKVRSK